MVIKVFWCNDIFYSRYFHWQHFTHHNRNKYSNVDFLLNNVVKYILFSGAYYPTDDHEHKYEGQTRKGQPNGEEKMTLQNGETYEGHWEDGVMDGHGKLSYLEQDKRDYYEGLFKRNKQNGSGKLVWKGGEVYHGNFKDGLPHGKGIYTYSEKHKREFYKGECKNGKANGFGKIVWKSGDLYKGNFQNDHRHGKEL